MRNRGFPHVLGVFRLCGQSLKQGSSRKPTGWERSRACPVSHRPQVLVAELHRRALVEYVRPLLRGRLRCRSARTRSRVAGRLREDAAQLQRLFRRLVSARLGWAGQTRGRETGKSWRRGCPEWGSAWLPKQDREAGFVMMHTCRHPVLGMRRQKDWEFQDQEDRKKGGGLESPGYSCRELGFDSQPPHGSSKPYLIHPTLYSGFLGSRHSFTWRRENTHTFKTSLVLFLRWSPYALLTVLEFAT